MRLELTAAAVLQAEASFDGPLGQVVLEIDSVAVVGESNVAAPSFRPESPRQFTRLLAGRSPERWAS